MTSEVSNARDPPHRDLPDSDTGRPRSPLPQRGVPFRSDVRRTPPRKATQIPGRSSPAGRSPVGRRPPAGHNDPPGATRPSPKDAPSDAPAYFAFSASVPTPRG